MKIGSKLVRAFFMLLILWGAVSPSFSRQEEFQLSVRDTQGNDIQLYHASYALVIGIAEYTAGWPSLRGVVTDIADVEKALKEQGFEVTVVKDVGRNQLVAAIEGFIMQHGSDPENRLFFYFAGHGYTLQTSYGEAMGYIVPADAPNPNIDRAGFKAKAVDMLLFENYAKSIDSKHVLFVFDSCFSGSIFATSRGIPEVISDKTAAPVRQFITSGSEDEYVPDKSVFKDQFIAGIRGEADLNGDSYVTASELGVFLEDKVVNYSKRTQHPQYGKIKNPRLDKGDFVFIPPQAAPKPVPKREPDIGSQIELEFWQSTKESNTVRAYAEYLNRYPRGVFSELAKQKLSDLNRAKGAEPAAGPAGAAKNPEPVSVVKLIQLPAPLVREYNDKIKTFSVPDFPPDIKVGGQVTLVYAVAPDGKLSVDSIKNVALEVAPLEREELVKGLIMAAAQAIVLPPPKDRAGNRVWVKNWPVSYQIGHYQDRLILSIIVF